jgi:hypothetical protein
MAMKSPEEERQWAAEKRDFVADRRDQLAGERDTAGGARDITADARESALDERERELNTRAAEIGLPPDSAEATAQRVDAGAGRRQARVNVSGYRASAMLPPVLVIRRQPDGYRPRRPRGWRRCSMR